jgi:hypothetical protein
VIFKKILGLAFIVGLLGLFIFKVELPKMQEATRAKLLLRGLSQDMLNSVKVTRTEDGFTLINTAPKEVKYLLDEVKSSKAAGNTVQPVWHLENKKDALLDPGSVDGLLRAITQVELGDPIAKEDIGEDWAIFGLEKPNVSITVTWKGGSSQVDIGKKSEYLGERYIKVNETKNVYLVPDTLFIAANKSDADIRDHTPVRFEFENLKKVALKTPQKQVTLEKTDVTWFVTEPLKVRADEAAFSEVIRKLHTLETTVFLDEAPLITDRYNLETPDLLMIVQDQKGTVEVRMGVSTGEIAGLKTYFSISPSRTIYEAEGNKIGDFILVESQLFDKKVFSFDVATVKKIAFDLNGEKTELELKVSPEMAPEWHVNGTKGVHEIVQGFATDLSLKEVFDLVEQEVEFSPIMTINIEAGENEKTELKIGPSETDEQGSFHRVKREGWGGAFKLSEDAYSSILPKKDAFVEQKTQQQEPSPTATSAAPLVD